MSCSEFCAPTCGVKMLSRRSKPSSEKVKPRVVHNDARSERAPAPQLSRQKPSPRAPDQKHNPPPSQRAWACLNWLKVLTLIYAAQARQASLVGAEITAFVLRWGRIREGPPFSFSCRSEEDY